MQIVIDIPQGLKDDFEYERWTALTCAMMKDALEKGIVLPKGHGAIKDISQIEIPMCEDRAYETWVQVAINAAPTIIEADEAESEE